MQKILCSTLCSWLTPRTGPSLVSYSIPLFVFLLKVSFKKIHKPCKLLLVHELPNAANEFANVEKIILDWKKVIKTSDFTLGKFVNDFEIVAIEKSFIDSWRDCIVDGIRPSHTRCACTIITWTS